MRNSWPGIGDKVGRAARVADACSVRSRIEIRRAGAVSIRFDPTAPASSGIAVERHPGGSSTTQGSAVRSACSTAANNSGIAHHRGDASTRRRAPRSPALRWDARSGQHAERDRRFRHGIDDGARQPVIGCRETARFAAAAQASWAGQKAAQIATRAKPNRACTAAKAPVKRRRSAWRPGSARACAPPQTPQGGASAICCRTPCHLRAI